MFIVFFYSWEIDFLLAAMNPIWATVSDLILLIILFKLTGHIMLMNFSR